MNPLVVIAVVLVFGFLVTFHEFGHYLLAKLNGVRVLEFNVGFGAPLVRKTWGETTYGIRSIPLGGYVRLAGVDGRETRPRSLTQEPVERRRDRPGPRVWRRRAPGLAVHHGHRGRLCDARQRRDPRRSGRELRTIRADWDRARHSRGGIGRLAQPALLRGVLVCEPRYSQFAAAAGPRRWVVGVPDHRGRSPSSLRPSEGAKSALRRAGRPAGVRRLCQLQRHRAPGHPLRLPAESVWRMTDELRVLPTQHEAGEVMAITGLRPRRHTAPVRVGDVIIGGAAPIAVQTMTKTDTRDVEGTVDQIARMADAGADVVRVTCNNREAGEAMVDIVQRSRLPIIADIHFDHRLALAALAAGVHGLRLNPGNIRDHDKVVEVVRGAREREISIRIGVNAGSLPPDEMTGAGYRGRGAVEKTHAAH